MVIAKVGSPTEVGRFALGLAVAAPIVLFTNLNLRAALVTDARDEHPVGAYVALRLVGTLTALSAIAMTASRYDRDAGVVILLVGVAKAVESLGDVIQGVLQRAERFRRISASLLARGAIGLIAIAAVMRASHSLALAVLCLALAWMCILAMVDFPAARRVTRLRPLAGWPALVQLAWVALPLGGVACMTSLIPNIPRYAVEAHLGQASLGYFAAMAYLMVAAVQPVLALGVAAVPRLATAYASDIREYRRLAIRMLGFGIALGVATVVGIGLFGRALLEHAYSPDYAVHGPVLNWLSIAAGLSFITSMLTYAVTAARRFTSQLWSTVFALAVCSAATVVLVPRYGLTGAAWALIAAEVSRLMCFGALFAMVLRQSEREQPAELELVPRRAEEATAAV
jgi:O-antigen/teichoic acid export membrane protein